MFWILREIIDLKIDYATVQCLKWWNSSVQSIGVYGRHTHTPIYIYIYIMAYRMFYVKLSLNATWWRHQMDTFSALLAICAGNSPVTGEFPHKGQWRGVLMFSLVGAWIDGWVNNGEAGDLRRHRAHYDVTVMNLSPITHLSEIWIEMQDISISNVVIKMSSAKYRPFEQALKNMPSMACTHRLLSAKKDETPLLTHWGYVFLALSHRHGRRN